jgi:cytochrome P450
VIAHVCGVPTEDQGRFQQWSDELLARQNAGAAGALSDVHPEFSAYIQSCVDERRAAADPPDDVITRFINTDVDGEFLSDRAVVTQLMFLIVAGNETTRNLLGNSLHTLATDPQLYERLRVAPELVPVLIEESLRHDSPVQVLGRAVLAATELDGCPVQTGDRVVFGVASANRDERIHECPDEFRVDRPKPRDHLAFGSGPHVCPGATLARMEATVLLQEFMSRVRAFEPTAGFEVERTPVFWALGHRSLRVTLTPA